MLNKEGIRIHLEVAWIRLRTVLRMLMGLIGLGIIGTAMWFGAHDGLQARQAHAMAGSPGMAGEVVGPAIAPWVGLFFVGAAVLWVAYR